MQNGKVNILIDGQYGSTGKGLVAGYLAKWNHIDIALTNAAPNAGHTYTDKETGHHFVSFHLPVAGVINPHCDIVLTAGAIIDPDIFLAEIDEHNIDPRRVFVHPHAAVIHECHKKAEADHYGGPAAIASTQKGVGAALADKVMRRGNVANQCSKLLPFVRDRYDLTDKLNAGACALMEVPQGFSLGINSGFHPYTTSREVSVAQALSDAQIHPSYLGDTIMSLRTYPIRVGHLEKGGEVIGNSGPYYLDQVELDWGEIGVPPELTTVTKRERRLFSFSKGQLVDASRLLRPDTVFLNFVNYLNDGGQLCEYRNMIRRAVSFFTGHEPKILYGTGPDVSHVHASYHSTCEAMGW